MVRVRQGYRQPGGFILPPLPGYPLMQYWRSEYWYSEYWRSGRGWCMTPLRAAVDLGGWRTPILTC
jgi:hypothetical protein